MGDVLVLDGGLFPEPPRQPGGDTSRGRGFAVEIERRLKDRQAAAIGRGQHPLSVALRTPLPLHPDALAATMAGEGGAGPTCGDCAHRGSYNPGHARSHPKCLIGSRVVARGGSREIVFPRVTNGEATDVRKSWPACLHFEPKGAAERGAAAERTVPGTPGGRTAP